MPNWQIHNMQEIFSAFPPLKFGEETGIKTNRAAIILSSMESVELSLPQNTVIDLSITTMSTSMKMVMSEP